MAYINFTSFVSNDPIEDTSKENIKNFDCIVEVYRSADNRDGRWGKSDGGYDQSFGFDRYNESTSGKGLGATKPFKCIHFLRNSSEGKIISYLYYIPWLCIWPPKAAIKDLYKKNAAKQEEGKWIDPSFTPVSEAKLYCRIDEGKDKKKDSGDLIFISNNEHLKVEGGETYSLTSKSVKDEFSIKISCTGVIKNDPKNQPKIEIRETDENGMVVGQINVVPNDEIYFGRAYFVPIEAEKNEAITKGQEERRKKAKEEFEKLVQEVLEYLNTKSFNQAFIYFDAEASEIITFPKDLIKVGSTGEYSASVSKAYFQGIPSEDDKDHKKKLKKSEKELDKAIKKYYKAIKKNYKKLRKKETYYLSKTMDGVSEEIVDDYKKKSEKHLKLLNEEVLNGRHERKKNTIYVFVDKDRDILREGSFEYGGYAYQGAEDAFIFNKSVKNRDYGVIAHEMAHTLNLGHIFELGIKELQEKQDKERKEEEKEEKLTNQAEKNSGETMDNNRHHIRNKKIFNQYYDDLNSLITYKADYVKKFEEKGYYEKIIERFNGLTDGARQEEYLRNLTVEKNTGSQTVVATSNPTQQIENSKSNVVEMSRSYTFENFMDYDTFPAPETSTLTPTNVEDKKNDDFSYKSFYKWQWDAMKKSDFLHKETLK